MSSEPLRVSIGSFKKQKKPSSNLIKDHPRRFDKSKCVLHLIDFTPIHIAKILALEIITTASYRDRGTILKKTIVDTVNHSIARKARDICREFNTSNQIDDVTSTLTDYLSDLSSMDSVDVREQTLLDEYIEFTDNTSNDISDELTDDVSNSYDEKDSSFDSLLFSLKSLSKKDRQQLKKSYLDSLIAFITDQYYGLWDLMKRGDLIEDISTSRFNDDLECIDDFYPTRGLYIVDVDNTDTSDVTRFIRNGLTIRYLTPVKGRSNLRVTPDNMYTITDFPIGYFDNVEINDMFCPGETSNVSWGGLCSVRLDVHKLKLDTLTVSDVKHKTKVTYRNDRRHRFDYIYTVLKYNNKKYMVISEYATKPIRYNTTIEKERFVKLMCSNNSLTPYDRTDDAAVKGIAQSEGVEIENVLCI